MPQPTPASPFLSPFALSGSSSDLWTTLASATGSVARGVLGTVSSGGVAPAGALGGEGGVTNATPLHLAVSTQHQPPPALWERVEALLVEAYAHGEFDVTAAGLPAASDGATSVPSDATEGDASTDRWMTQTARTGTGKATQGSAGACQRRPHLPLSPPLAQLT